LKRIFILVVTVSLSLMAVEVGQPLPSVTLSGKQGGYANGKSWESTKLKGHSRLIIYMDPDKRKNIDSLMKALSRNTSHTFTTVAIVNLAATWMPNRVLISKLNKQRSKMKQTEYIFDKKRILVSRWGLPDDDTTVMVVNAAGNVLYAKSGKLTDTDVAAVLHKVTQ